MRQSCRHRYRTAVPATGIATAVYSDPAEQYRYQLPESSTSAVVKKMVFRPPAMRIKKVLGIRRVAPERPAMAASENNSDFAYGNPRFSICTVIMPQYSQTAKPHNRLGMEIHRLRVAMDLPDCGPFLFVFRVPALNIFCHYVLLTLFMFVLFGFFSIKSTWLLYSSWPISRTSLLHPCACTTTRLPAHNSGRTR